MGRGYSLDFREAVLKYRDRGHSQQETADYFEICRKSISRWEAARVANNGQLKAFKPRGPSDGWKLPRTELKAYYEAKPDSTQKEAAEHFGCSAQGIEKGLRRIGFTRKKKIPAYKERDPKKKAGI